MLRRLSAILGIILLVAILIALVWAVHQHRLNTGLDSEGNVRLGPGIAAQQTEGERPC